jgi:sRNA-binding carbon storage regulator CsrA
MIGDGPDQIVVEVLPSLPGTSSVRIGITAPRGVAIIREELIGTPPKGESNVRR